MTRNDLGREDLPRFPDPYWKDFIQLPTFPALQEDLKVDVVIIGGGITGITAAYLLVKEGLKVALLEANRLVNGTTGHTTAKITAQHDLIYDELISHMGQTKARLYYEANSEALQFIKQTVSEHQINCDFSQQDAYIYATTKEYAHKLEQEYSAYQQLRIPGELVNDIPFDINIHNALSMKDQAQFHPLAYLDKLVQLIVENGGLIFENSMAIDLEEGDQPTVITREGQRVTANYVLSCSHFPFYDGMGFYFTRLQAQRSYVIAIKTKKEFPGGMYISADQPTRSLRSVSMNGEDLVLIGGDGHKTGQGKDTLEHYKALEAFAHEVFDVKEILYRWSTQDLVTLDKVPYIGEITANHHNVLVATGYRKWGMTNSTAAALLLRDIVLKRDNPYLELYRPSRFYINPSLKEFFAVNLDVAKHLISGKLEVPDRKIEDLADGEGCVVLYNGERAGAYKNEKGQLFVVDTTCTHLGCETEWNHGDRTWDCPCHGSRFSHTGEVLEGPAELPLKRLH
ncbi:FAD dependent oxidoreductase family protein [Brevibacillus laterosporus GI-9]|uniref:FAD-dependent oxidoreductase n=1 Tax=Brevibacillus TaxID=55080 RepID=UPI0002404557|nr:MULTISPECIES: FAD-dependent oxidoreductase [Brevibacillus]MCR8963770.1 FAD-dependent oxidoreductase [Brevibacillus laterosporus]MCZ0835926.1 FAD-dependent oxidoreductase [Brevibacillus halotolerans]CCF12666.1 FAD dependent oxidoreductase family protein [Brevibacillus laterosporus GI-9]